LHAAFGDSCRTGVAGTRPALDVVIATRDLDGRWYAINDDVPMLVTPAGEEGEPFPRFHHQINNI
jgi:hypothetical protein